MPHALGNSREEDRQIDRIDSSGKKALRWKESAAERKRERERGKGHNKRWTDRTNCVF